MFDVPLAGKSRVGSAGKEKYCGCGCLSKEIFGGSFDCPRVVVLCH